MTYALPISGMKPNKWDWARTSLPACGVRFCMQPSFLNRRRSSINRYVAVWLRGFHIWRFTFLSRRGFWYLPFCIRRGIPRLGRIGRRPWPNPAVNADAPVHAGNLANAGGGPPVTLIR